MTVADLVKTLNLKVLTGSEESLSRTVKGGYCGDLLSWVMGRAPRKGAWITIMSNINVAAVAGLADISCVILAEGVSPDAKLLERAEDEGLPLLQSPEGTFVLAGKMYGLL